MPVMVESAGTSPKLDARIILGHRWLKRFHEDVSQDWYPVAGDASNRRYFRVRVDGKVHVVMDAPPEFGSSKPFVDVCKRLRHAGLHAPKILRRNLKQGFIMLEDLGNDLYRDIVHKHNAQPFFDEAFTALAVMARDVNSEGLPEYDEARLHDELHLFTDHYLIRHLEYHMVHHQRILWRDLCEELVGAMLEQPTVFVHRDIHSCNLLRTEENSPGIIDFQDAVRGPLTYDFVSLIWDRYIAWPRDQLELWMEQFRLMVASDTDPQQWIYWCDMTGLQRNIRIVGRFAQLLHSEGKPGYIKMAPQFYQYILDTLRRYPQFAGIKEWFGSEQCVP